MAELTKSELAQNAADTLIGQCMTSIEIFMYESEHPEWIDDPEFLAAWDDLAFVCDGCGWTCGSDEANDNGSGFECDDCASEHDSGDQ